MRILWVSRLGYTCSYSAVTTLLLSAFKKKYPEYDIHVFCTGIVHYEYKIKNIADDIGIPVTNVNILRTEYYQIMHGEDLNWYNDYRAGVFDIDAVIKKVNPDLIICIEDDGAVKKLLKNITVDVPFVPYIAIDSSGYDLNINTKTIWTMTNFGKIEIEKFNTTSKIEVLPHIVDSTSFYPITNKSTIKAKWLGQHAGKFVIGSINANHVRKRWDILIEAFCRFASTYSNTILLIKTDKMSQKTSGIGLLASHNYDLNKILHERCGHYGIDKSRIISIERSCTMIELNELYNCCDLGLTTTSGEGWGLTPCEMALCQVPSIVPAYSSFVEIYGINSPNLIPAHLYPDSVGRYTWLKPSWENPDVKLNNMYECICKSYESYESHQTISKNLLISLGAPTIILSNAGSDRIASSIIHNFLSIDIQLLQHFKTIDFLIAYIKTEPLPNRFQILLHSEISYELSQYDRISDLQSTLTQLEKRSNYFISKKDPKKSAYVGIPYVSDVVKKMIEFYSKADLRYAEGIRQRHIMLENYNMDKCVVQLKKLIDTAT